MRSLQQAATLLATCGLLYGCASPPVNESPPAAPQDEVAPPVVVLPPQPTSYELNQIELARSLAREGKLAEASLIWEVLMTIRPGVADYRNRWNELQRQSELAAAEHIQKAEQAAARGQLDGATQQYLAALALQPSNTRTADALRGIERERNKRNYLGKLSRNTLTRRAMSEAEVGAPASEIDPAPRPSRAAELATMATPRADPTSSRDNKDLEQASLLSSKGELDPAIRLLEKRVATDRRDEAARHMLADLYFQKAETLASSNRLAAVALLQRSVRANPSHPAAPLRLRELRSSAVPVRPAPGAVATTQGQATATVPTQKP